MRLDQLTTARRHRSAGGEESVDDIGTSAPAGDFLHRRRQLTQLLDLVRYNASV
jgi:hypothetical protein